MLSRHFVHVTPLGGNVGVQVVLLVLVRQLGLGRWIFTAVQEQLGLRFDSVKAPADVLVIDHVDRPTAN